jgi:peptide/nickel transport system ATP-binding protein
MSMIIVTHDMGVIAETADKVTVMYAGRVCETADTATIFKRPAHPYTEALLSSVPRIDVERGTLEVIPGNIPDMINPPRGCRFHPRCKYAASVCSKKMPELEGIKDRHYVACLYAMKK